MEVNILLSIAFALGNSGAGAGAAQGNPFGPFMMLAIIFGIFYFLLIRPQQKKAKLHKEMLQNIKRGEYIITTGGLHGRIHAITDDVLTIEIADNVKVRVSRGHIWGISTPEGKVKKEGTG